MLVLGKPVLMEGGGRRRRRWKMKTVEKKVI